MIFCVYRINVTKMEKLTFGFTRTGEACLLKV
jgi:hypothetical protein